MSGQAKLFLSRVVRPGALLWSKRCVPSRCAASPWLWPPCDLELTRSSGSSFAENFYGLRRRRRPGLSSSRTKGFSATPRASLARYEALRAWLLS